MLDNLVKTKVRLALPLMFNRHKEVVINNSSFVTKNTYDEIAKEETRKCVTGQVQSVKAHYYLTGVKRQDLQRILDCKRQTLQEFSLAAVHEVVGALVEKGSFFPSQNSF